MLETRKGGEDGRQEKRDSEMQRCGAREEERREKAKFSEKRKERDGEREGSGLCRGAAYRGLENALFRLHSHRLGMGVSRA